MALHSLPSITSNKYRRLGRGHGSGSGKTAGRGTKGKKARGSVSLSFEGGALPLIKRMPFLRGKGRNKSFKPAVWEVTLSDLNSFSAKAEVTLDALIKEGVIDSTAKRVKVVATGELKRALTVKVPVTRGAREQIEKAGGTVELSL